MNRFSSICLVTLVLVSIASLVSSQAIGAQFDSRPLKQNSKKSNFKTSFNFILKNGKISGLPKFYKSENALKLISNLEKALGNTDSQTKFRFSKEQLSIENKPAPRKGFSVDSISESLSMENRPAPKRGYTAAATSEEYLSESQNPRKIPRRRNSFKMTEEVKSVIKSLENEFILLQQEKSFLDIVNFKQYYEEGGEKVYYSKGISTKWIVLIIVIIIIILIVVCCCLFYMGVFNACSDCLNSGESEPQPQPYYQTSYEPQYQVQQPPFYVQGYQPEQQYYQEEKYYYK